MDTPLFLYHQIFHIGVIVNNTLYVAVSRTPRQTIDDILYELDNTDHDEETLEIVNALAGIAAGYVQNYATFLNEPVLQLFGPIKVNNDLPQPQTLFETSQSLNTLDTYYDLGNTNTLFLRASLDTEQSEVDDNGHSWAEYLEVWPYNDVQSSVLVPAVPDSWAI